MGINFKIKNLVIEKSYFLYFIQRIVRKSIQNKRVLKQKLKPEIRNIKTELQIKNNNSDTVFILGSGASINQLTPKQWDIIKKNDSIGFNFWPIHDFVPKYFVFELPRQEDRKEFFFEILKNKKDQYKNVEIIIKDYAQKYQTQEDFKKLGELFEQIYALDDINLLPPKKSLLNQTIKYTQIYLRLFNKKDRVLKVPKLRATLSYVIYLSYLLGYKNIVLTGIDLVNTNYFYEDPMYLEKSFRIPSSGQNKMIHKTNDPEEGEVIISKIIEVLNNEIFKKSDVNLYIANKQSALYPTLSYYWDNIK